MCYFKFIDIIIKVRMKKFLYISVSLFLIISSVGKCADYVGWTVGAKNNGYGAIYSTVNSGSTWIRQGSNQIANANLSGVFAVDPKTAWAVGDVNSNYATIYYTDDGGTVWSRKGFGQPALQDISLAKIHVSSNNIWAIGKNAILRSIDNGNSWTNCLPIEYTNTLLQGVFSINGSTVWVSGEGTSHVDFATMLKTTDAGQTWIRQTEGYITNANHLLGISAANTQTLWAVGGNDFLVLHSDNGGNLWTKQPSQGGLGDANEVFAVNTQTVWVAADPYIEWTNNGGLTWTNKTTMDYTMGISAVNTQEVWSVVRDPLYNLGYIYHTGDGGATWDAQVFTNTPLWTISFAQQAIPEPFYLSFIIYQLLFIIYLKRK